MKPDMEEEAPNSLPSRETWLLHASELICSLISSSYSTRSFPVKWQLIRNKLEQLHTGLTAAAICNFLRANSVLTEYLQDLISTANDANLLAQQCSDESYGGGKLRLKSDIDALASKLEVHLKRLCEIYASGILTHSQAIVVLKPGPGASRDDMMFYVKDLFSRLKIADSEMKFRALTALNEVLHEDGKYVKIMAAAVEDSASVLVNFLESTDTKVQEAAAEAISVVAGFESYKGALVMAGVITQLIQVLETGEELAKERAAGALKKLTQNSDNAWSVSAQGGVSTLLKICSSDGSSGELICTACSILKSLSGVDEIKRFMVEEGAVSVFVKLSRSIEEILQIQAIEFLTVLASGDESIKQKMVKEGVVGSLVQVLDPDSPHSSKAREVALRAIENISFSSPSCINFLVSSGFLYQVLFFLKNGEISIQESALKTVSRLSGLSEMTKKAMGDAGFMPELMKLLEAKSFQVREMAAEALCGIVSIQRNRKRFTQEEQNVNRLLQLLNPEEEKSATKKYLLSALMYLTDSNSVRRKINSSGHVKYLEKLAETDGKDAKKIVKKLSTNRFRSMLTGIWSS